MNRLLVTALVGVLGCMPLSAQDIPLSKILVNKEEWREFAKGVRPFFLETSAQGITAHVGAEDKEIVLRYDFAGKIVDRSEKKEQGLWKRNRAVTTGLGVTYAIDRLAHGVRAIVDDKEVGNITFASPFSVTALAVWPDEGHLVVGGYGDDAYLWAYRIEADGKLGKGDRYYSLRHQPEETMDVAAITLDAGYLLYACTPLGIQVFDPTGRLSGVIAAPSKDSMRALAIGGDKGDTLFVASGDKIYARRIQGKAAYTLKKGPKGP